MNVTVAKLWWSSYYVKRSRFLPLMISLLRLQKQEKKKQISRHIGLYQNEMGFISIMKARSETKLYFLFAYTHTHTHTHIYIYIYIYIYCVCIYVSMCVWVGWWNRNQSKRFDGLIVKRDVKVWTFSLLFIEKMYVIDTWERTTNFYCCLAFSIIYFVICFLIGLDR